MVEIFWQSYFLFFLFYQLIVTDRWYNKEEAIEKHAVQRSILFLFIKRPWIGNVTTSFPWIFDKITFSQEGYFFIALKPRGLLLSLPPEKEGKESAKGGIMFPPFEPLTKAAAAGLLRKPGKYAGSKWAALPAQIAVIPRLHRSPNFFSSTKRKQE